MRTNLVQTTNVAKTGISLRSKILRGALLVLLPLLTVGNAWASHDKHYGKAVLQNATGNGTVYLSTASGSNGGQSGSSNPGQVDGTSWISWNCGEDSGGDSKTYYARWSATVDGYYFAGWSDSKTATSYTASTTGKTFSTSSTTEGSPTTTTIYGHFKPVTVTAAPSVGIIYATDPTATYPSTAGETASFTTANSNRIGDFTTSESGDSRLVISSWTRVSATSATFNYKLAGNGSYGTDNRTLTKTVTLTSKGDAGSTKSCTVTAKYPNPRVIGGDNQEIFTTFKGAEAQVAVTKTAEFDVVYGDNGNNFTGSFSGEVGGGTWTVTGVTVNQTTQKATVTYTFNGNKAVGTHQATLTLTANDCNGWDDTEAAGSASASITITAENEQEADYDVEVYNASGTKISDNTTLWAAGLALANANAGSTLKLVRDIDLTATYGVSATQAITQTFTLDLNGKTLSASILGSILNPKTSGKTLTIKDSKTGGKIENIAYRNDVVYGINVGAGVTLNIEGGCIYAENTAQYAYGTSTYTDGTPNLQNMQTRAIHMAATSIVNISGGKVHAVATRNARAIHQESSAANNTVLNITGGEVLGEAPCYAYGVYAAGKVNISGGSVNALLNDKTVDGNTTYTANAWNDYTLHRYGYAVMMVAVSNATQSSNYFGTLTITGGTINATNVNKTLNAKSEVQTEHTYGIYLNVSATGAGAGKTAPDGTKVMKACAIGSMENATININHSGRTSYGVMAVGCYNSFDNKTTPFTIKNSTINVTGFQDAFGVYATAYVNWSSSLANHTGNGGCTYGNIELTNTTINATTTGAGGAYCGWASCTSGTVANAKATTGSQSTGNATYCGEYAAAGRIVVNSGTYTASAATSSAYGFGSSERAKTVRSIKGALISRDAATDPLGSLGGNAEAYPELYIHGGDISATTGTSTTAIAVKSGGNTVIDGGTFNAYSGAGTAYGLYVTAGKTTASGVTFPANATTVAYGVYATGGISDWSLYPYAGEVELNNCNVTAIARTTTNARAVYIEGTSKIYTQASFDAMKSANNSNYQNYGDYAQVGERAVMGKVTINGGTYTATAETTTAYGIVVAGTKVSTNKEAIASGHLVVKNATVTAKTNTGTTAYGVQPGGGALIENCTISATAATTTASGVRAVDKTTKIKNSTISAKGTDAVYGLEGYVEISSAHGYCWHGEFDLTEAGTTKVTAESTASSKPAYAIYLKATNRNIASGSFAGDYATAANATINEGEYIAKINGGTSGYALALDGQKTQGSVVNQPEVLITGGKFNGATAEVGTAGIVGHVQLKGGVYVHNTNLSKYIPEGYEEVPLTSERPEYTEGYRYEIATEGMHGIAVCKNTSTNKTYNSLEEALQEVGNNQTILMLANYVMAIPGDYVLPAGATLLVPRSGQTSAQGTTIASGLRSNERVAPTVNMTLTLASGVNLAAFGIIETGGLENDASGGSQTGCTHGAFGRIILRGGAHIDLESGSRLQCWGYVTGDGTITAKSGSQVYEYFEIAVNKGGTILSGMISGTNKVFPVDNYFYQNIESEITYMPGCQAFASSGMYIQGNRPANSVKIVGATNEHLFKMSTDGSRPNMWVKKKYDPTTDRCTWTMNDGAQLSSINITISGYGMNSADFVLPISSSMDIVMNYGTLSIASGQDVMLIPGSRIIVKKDAVLQIPSGMKFYVWDVAQWGKGSPSAKYAWSSLYQPDRTTNPRAGILTDKTNLPSGELFVQGTIEVTGAFQTTAGGAYIHSTNEDAGQIVYKAAATATGKVYQRTDAGSDQQSATTSAKLQNGDGTYEATAGTASGEKWIYRDNKWVKVSTSGCFVVETISGTPHYYAHPKDWVEVTANSPDDHAYHVTADPTRYVIQGADCNWIEVIPSDGYYKCINENSIYYNSYFEWSSSNGYWVEKLVTVKFDNQGSVTTYSNIPFKSRPYYVGTTPTKTSSNANYYYVWTGWDTSSSNTGAAEYGKQEGDLPEATGDVTYYAHFDQRYYQYNITFKNSDGTVLESKLWNKGTTPSYEGTPTKTPTTSTVYTFNGTWTPAISVVSQAQEYVANYSEAPRPYEVKFLNFDNEELEVKNVNYGTNPTYTGEEPYRAGTPAFSWDFTGWKLQSTGASYGKTATLPSVAGPQIYIAEYDQVEVKYAITFRPENGDANETKQWKYEQMPSYSKGTPVKESTAKYSYTFAGWDPAVVVATENATYTATYNQTIRKYLIQFVDDDNTTSLGNAQVEYDATPTPPSVSNKQDAYWNYTFDHWNPSVTTVSGPATYTAVYTKTGRSYTVTLNNQSATTPGTASVTVNYNDAMPSITVPTKNYNDFGGYFSEVNGGGTKYYNVDGSSAHVWDRAENDPVLYAKWTPAQYTITYKDQGNVAFSGSHESGYPTSHTYGTATTLKSATKTGYTFDGWYTSQDCSTGKVTELGATAFTANITLYAKWNINQYTISFNSNGGSAVADIKQNYNTAVTAPADPTKTGYTFAGWDPAVPSTMPAENTNCVAQWTINQYTISFNSNGGSAVAAITQNYNTAVTAPTDPTKTGYTFAGWDPVVPNPMPATNTTCAAQWTPVPYTITYNLNGGSATNPENYTIETATFTLNNPTRTGYTFDGWTGSNGSTPQTNVSIAVGSTGNREYTANWTAIKYNITFANLNGAGSSQTIEVAYDQHPVSPVTPEKVSDCETYPFTGWRNSANTFFDKDTELPLVTGAETYTAQFSNVSQKTEFKVSFDMKGHGDAPAEQSVECTEHATEPTAPTAEGYTFGGWFKEYDCNNQWNFSTDVVNGTTILYAKWTVNTHALAWNFDGGSTSSTTHTPANNALSYGTAISYPANNTMNKTGYTFAGWSSSVTTMPDNDLTITALWTRDTYTIGYTLDGGTATNPANYNVETATFTLTNPTRTGYTFAGWTGTGLSGATMVVTIPTGSTGNRTYTATWAIDTYTIGYTLNGGTATNPANYNVETATFTLNNPTRNGYDFAGWTGTGLSGATTTVTITKGSTGDRTYTATWTPTNYTITYNLDGGSATNPGSYTIVTATFELNNPTRTGYDFAGWTGSNGSTPQTNVSIVAGSTGNRTYTANWTPKQYTITWLNEDNSQFDQTTVAYGTVPTHAGPTKAATAEYTYTFAGWDPAPVAVTGNATYKATFNQTKNSYTIRWLNDNGSQIDQTTVEYGVVPTHAAPEKVIDNCKYEFLHWDVTPVAVTGDATYTAVFSDDCTMDNFLVVFQNYDGTPLYATEVAGGETPVYGGEEPIKAGEDFSGWSPALGAISNHMVYTAQFSEPAFEAERIKNGVRVSTGTWATMFSEANQAANAGSTIKLHKDVTATANVTVSQNMTIDLNGCTMSCSTGSNGVSRIFNVGAVSLTIDDSMGGGIISFTGTRNNTSYYAIDVYNTSGSLTVNGGTIRTSRTGSGTNYYAAAVRLYNTNSTVNLNGGALEASASTGKSYAIYHDGGSNYGKSNIAGGKLKASTDIFYGVSTNNDKASGGYYSKDPGNIGLVSGYSKVTPTEIEGYTHKVVKSGTNSTITWKDDDGSNLIPTTTSVPYNTTPTHDAPTKAGGTLYQYDFAGWNPGIVPAQYDITYTATYHLKIKIGWNVEGNIIYDWVKFGEMPSHADPVKPADAQYTYTFAGWTPDIEPATCPKTYTAQFNEELNSYTITFANLDGNNSQQEEYEFAYGATPVCLVTPMKEEGGKAYEFLGWDPEIALVTGNATYTATFSDTPSKTVYTITWKDDQGNTIETTKVAEDELPTHAAPVKANTDEYTYTFTGWSPSVVPATANATYTATFSGVKNKYTITFEDYDGTVIQSQLLDYGTAIVAPANPSRPAYNFNGWSPTVAATVTGDATYTAQYSFSGNVASVTNAAGTSTQYYTSLDDARTAANSSNNCTVRIYTDITVTGYQNITANMTLDLNGYTITRNATGANQPLLYPNGVALTIEDSRGGGGIRVNGSTNATYYAVLVNESGSVTINGGTIEANVTYNGNNAIAAAVYFNSNNATLNLNGGTLLATASGANGKAYAVYGSGYSNIRGGKLNAKTSIFYNANAGRTKLYGGYYTQDPTSSNGTVQTGYSKQSVTADEQPEYGEGYRFKVVKTSCVVTWLNYDGTDLWESEVSGGNIPTYGGPTPKTPDATAQYEYVFAGWDPEVSVITDDITYTAQFTPVLRSYAITWQDGDGKTLQTADVEYGQVPTYTGLSIPTKTATAEYSYVFNSTWSPTPYAVDKDQVYTAQFNSIANKYTLTWELDGGSITTEGTPAGLVAYGTTLTAPIVEKAGYTFAGWSDGSSVVTPTTMPAANTTYTATWTLAETGFYVNIVDVDNSAKTLTLNVTGWGSSGWPYYVNNVAYGQKSTSGQAKYREDDRTLIITYTGEPGADFDITVRTKTTDGTIVSKHTYIIPQEITSPTELTGNQNKPLFVKGTTLTINANITAQNIYIKEDAKLIINSGKTLTADSVFLRTTTTNAAEMKNQGTLSAQLCYTRIIKDKSQYYLFGLPYDCPLSSVKLSDGSTVAYSSAWLLRSYSESSRANNGAGANWVNLAAGSTIKGGVGYEMYSAYNYYREFYFPVTPTNNKTVEVFYTANGTAGENHRGWNIITSPLTATCEKPVEPEGLTVCWLEDGNVWGVQEQPTSIPPAKPFAYQASENQSVLSFANVAVLAPRRVTATEEPIQIQWIHLDVEDANGVGDQTSIYSHPTRYDEVYQTGIDVAKQSLTASRAIIYSSHVYGDMAFAGVADSLLEQGVALTVYSPSEQELTISMRENDWLNRMENVWLVDRETGLRVDLLWSDYAFRAQEGTTTGRLFIEGAFKAPQITTDIEPTSDSSLKGRDARKVIINDKIYIIVNGRMFDSTGKLVLDK